MLPGAPLMHWLAFNLLSQVLLYYVSIRCFQDFDCYFLDFDWPIDGASQFDGKVCRDLHTCSTTTRLCWQGSSCTDAIHSYGLHRYHHANVGPFPNVGFRLWLWQMNEEYFSPECYFVFEMTKAQRHCSPCKRHLCEDIVSFLWNISRPPRQQPGAMEVSSSKHWAFSKPRRFRLRLWQKSISGLSATSFLKRERHQGSFSLVTGTSLTRNCKSQLEHFKGAKVTTGYNGSTIMQTLGLFQT